MKMYYYVRLILLYVLCFLYANSIAQKQGQPKIDSLLKELKNYKDFCSEPCLKDSNKVKLLNLLSYEFSSRKPDSAILFSNQMLNLSQKINWVEGIGLSYNAIGVGYLDKGQSTESLKFFDSALHQWQLMIEKEISKSRIKYIKTCKNATLGDIGLAYEKLGDLNKAMDYGQEVVRIFRELGEIRKANQGLLNIGNIYKEQGDYNNAIEKYNEVLKLAQKYGDRDELGKSLASIGVVYWYKGDYSNALHYCLNAKKIFEELKNANACAKIQNMAGLIYYRRQDFLKALSEFSESLKINEEMKDEQGISLAQGNLGLVYNGIGEKYEAKKDTIQADLSFKKSLELYLKAEEIYEKLEMYPDVAINLNSIGIIYDKQKSYTKALDFYNRALKMDESIGDKYDFSAVLGNIGNVYTSLKKYNEAKIFLFRALELSDSIGAIEFQKTNHEYLSELYSQKGDFALALEQYKMAIINKDSLLNDEKTKDITRLEMNYEFDKKESLAKAEYDKQIAVSEADKLRGIAEADKKRALLELNKNIELAAADKKFTQAEANKQVAIAEADKKRLIAEADRKNIKIASEKQMANAKLENEKQKLLRNSIAAGAGVIILSSLFIFFFYKRKRDADQKQKETALSLQVSETEMKALRSQMNPHFIFNALQSIQTFLMSHQPDDANTYLLKFSKLMRLVLENSQHSEVPLKEDMQALELYMQLESIRLPHPFTYQFHIDENIDVEETTIPPLILQPFVENAIWHGLQYKPKPGHIDIYIIKNESALYATVEDDGVGREVSKKAAQPIFMKKESLGMKLTEERLKILNELKNIKADFKIIDLFTNDNKPAGTKVELFLPLDG